MKRLSLVTGALAAAGAALLISDAYAQKDGPPPVARIDVDRYLGTWYALAHYPTRFEKGCENTQAIYSKRDDGNLTVENRCTKEGAASGVKGKAWIPDPKEPGKLKVQFFWPFSADYWVHEVGPNYEWALVGNPKRSYAWILSRTPAVPPEQLDALKEKLRGYGYDLAKLRLIPQKG